MRKYTLTIEGDFEKYECNNCPLGILSISGFVCPMDDRISCPLEEVDVTDTNVGNKVKQGEWIDNIVERLGTATESVYNEVEGDYFDYIKTADAIEIVRGGKE